MTLKVIIRPGKDSAFIASVPALRGCWSQGASRDEAVVNIREAISGWLEAEQDKAAAHLDAGEVELVQV